ncbi:MAG: hypothetical protein WKF71_15095 [Pyrinomonadaceae bacterium]
MKQAKFLGIGLQEAEADLIVEYLEGEGLIKTHDDSGSLISITHSGILEVEQANSESNKPTEHFHQFLTSSVLNK